jgi:hypothetical protein
MAMMTNSFIFFFFLNASPSPAKKSFSQGGWGLKSAEWFIDGPKMKEGRRKVTPSAFRHKCRCLPSIPAQVEGSSVGPPLRWMQGPELGEGSGAFAPGTERRGLALSKRANAFFNHLRNGTVLKYHSSTEG